MVLITNPQSTSIIDLVASDESTASAYNPTQRRGCEGLSQPLQQIGQAVDGAAAAAACVLSSSFSHPHQRKR